MHFFFEHYNKSILCYCTSVCVSSLWTLSLCSCGTSAVSRASGACGSVTVEVSVLLCKCVKLLSLVLWLSNSTEAMHDLGEQKKSSQCTQGSVQILLTKLWNRAHRHVMMRERQSAGSAPAVAVLRVAGQSEWDSAVSRGRRLLWWPMFCFFLEEWALGFGCMHRWDAVWVMAMVMGWVRMHPVVQ